MVLTAEVAALESLAPDPAATAAECLQPQRSTRRSKVDDLFRMRAIVSSKRVSDNPGLPFWHLAHRTYALRRFVCNRIFCTPDPGANLCIRCMRDLQLPLN